MKFKTEIQSSQLEQEKGKQRLFYRDGLCWSLVWYANSWIVMGLKCFMSRNVHLEFQVLCLGVVIFLSISGILGVYAISATFCSLFSSVSKLTHHWQWRFCKLIRDPSDTLLCGCYANLYHTHSRDQPPLKSTLFQLKV